MGDLAGHPLNLGRAVAMGDADEGDQAWAVEVADDDAVNLDPRAAETRCRTTRTAGSDPDCDDRADRLTVAEGRERPPGSGIPRLGPDPDAAQDRRENHWLGAHVTVGDLDGDAATVTQPHGIHRLGAAVPWR